MPALSRIGLRWVQEHGMDGNPRIRNGASERARRGRRGFREVHGVGIRHGPGANRHVALRHSRHPPVVRFRHEISGAARTMNASYQWLKDFVDIDISPSELRDLLTMRCATVDDVVALRQDLNDIVIGRVIEAAPHPNSDHLWVTRVDAGDRELRDVVCGAPNVAVGTLYPFAPVGATLPGGLKIEKRKIRGAVSEG